MRPRAKILLLLLLLLSPLSLHAEGPRWTVRVHPSVLAGLDYSDLASGRITPAEVVEKLKSPDFGNQLASFLDLCRRQGVTEIVLDGVQPELKGIYFRSPALEAAGWVVLADVLGQLRIEAVKRKLKIGLGLSELGIHARELYDEDYGLRAVKKLLIGGLEPLFRELVGSYGLASVRDEEFPAAWFQPLLSLSQQLGFRYVRGVSADDIISLTAGPQRMSPLQAFPKSLTLSTKDEDPMLAPAVEAAVTNGQLALMLSDRPPVVDISDRQRGRLFLEGGILFRALQSAPEEFALRASRETLTRLTPGLFRRAADLIGKHDASFPLLNLVVLATPRTKLDPGQVAWLQLGANLEPLSLAFAAAGFEVRMTDRILPDARAYYVYLAGNAREDWNQCQAVLEQRPEVPVFVQLGSEPERALLDDLGRFLGFRSAVWVNGLIPPLGLYRGRQITYNGPDLYAGHVPAGYLQLNVDLHQVLMTDGSRSPLLTVSPRLPSRFFVNSNRIHRDLAFPISHLLTSGKALQRPAACLIAVAKKTAFWALGDTEVEWVHPRTGERLVLEMKAGGFHVE